MVVPNIESVANTLRRRPRDFFIQDSLLYQKNSTIGFGIHHGGLISAKTLSDGSWRLLSVQDAIRLSSAFEEWQRNYWVATRVNKIFARQLRQPGFWRRLWHYVEHCLPERAGESALAIYARAFAGDEFPGPGPTGEPPSRHLPRPWRPTSGGNAAELHRVLQLAE